MSAAVMTQALRQRRRSLLWWSVGTAALLAAIVASWPATRDAGEALQDYVDSLPEGLVELFGLGAGLASPAGFLSSQWYANTFPVLLLVLGVGMSAWTVAGSEADGTLEMLLANPVTRSRVAIERFAAVAVVTGTLVLAATVLLAAVAPVVGLDDGLAATGLWAAGAGVWALTLACSSVAFAVGAATGSRGAALGAGGGLAAATYVLLGVVSSVDGLAWARWLSPWSWFLTSDPLTDGFAHAGSMIGLPLLLTALAVALGTWRFARRDLG